MVGKGNFTNCKKVAKKVVGKGKLNKVIDGLDDKRLSVIVEDAMAEVSERIFTRLHDEGFIPDRLYDDTNAGTDLLNAIESELRKCIRG